MTARRFRKSIATCKACGAPRDPTCALALCRACYNEHERRRFQLRQDNRGRRYTGPLNPIKLTGMRRTYRRLGLEQGRVWALVRKESA